MGALSKTRPVLPPQLVPMTVDAVVFDMDGTLLDTETLYRDAFMAAANSLGVVVPPPLRRAGRHRDSRARPHPATRYGRDFPLR